MPETDAGDLWAYSFEDHAQAAGAVPLNRLAISNDSNATLAVELDNGQSIRVLPQSDNFIVGRELRYRGVRIIPSVDVEANKVEITGQRIPAGIAVYS